MKLDFLRTISVFFIFMFIYSWAGAASASENYFPLAKGNKWIYEADLKYIDNGAPVSKKLEWTMEVTGCLEDKNGTFAVIKGHPSMLTFYEKGSENKSVAIIRIADKYYLLNRVENDYEKLMGELKTGKVKFESLIENADLVLDFPLAPQKIYGIMPETDKKIAEEQKKWCWYVRESNEAPLNGIKGIGSKKAKIFTLTYDTNPDSQKIKFVCGLGMTEYSYIHHGTPGDVEAILKEASLVK